VLPSVKTGYARSSDIGSGFEGTPGLDGDVISWLAKELSVPGSPRRVAMESKIVVYDLDDSTKVSFEIDPPPGFLPASSGEVVGRVRDAIAPALETAKLVLDKAKEHGPDELTVRFGLKVSGKADWFIARAAAESNFEVTLVWRDRHKSLKEISASS
jgi:hypothetical protein